MFLIIFLIPLIHVSSPWPCLNWKLYFLSLPGSTFIIIATLHMLCWNWFIRLNLSANEVTSTFETLYYIHVWLKKTRRNGTPKKIAKDVKIILNPTSIHDSCDLQLDWIMIQKQLKQLTLQEAASEMHPEWQGGF